LIVKSFLNGGTGGHPLGRYSIDGGFGGGGPAGQGSGERVEGILEEASLKINERGLNQAVAGRIFSVTMETRGARRQDHAIKEIVSSLFALKVPVWLELIAKRKHVQ